MIEWETKNRPRSLTMPKALLVNCSPRKNGNTAAMLAEVNTILEASGIETETMHIG